MDMVAAGWKRFTATEFLVTTYLQTSVRAQGEMGMTVTLAAGQSLEEWIEWLLRYRRNPVDDETLLSDGLEEHERIMRLRLELQARYIAAAMNFLNTPLLCTRTKGPPNRATRKRFEREAVRYSPEIQIIELRKRKYIDEVRAADGDVVAYTPHVRFMVGWADQGFWNTYHTKYGVLERWIMPLHEASFAHRPAVQAAIGAHQGGEAMTTGVNVYERLQGEVNELQRENERLKGWVNAAEQRAAEGQERFEEAEA